MTEITIRSDMGIELVQHMGSDEMVARAARVSTGSDLIEPKKITGLINYLVREGHTSTLEHCLVTIRAEVPIFVAREWMRHRTQSFNEISGRYAKLEPVFYSPEVDRPFINEGTGAHPKLVEQGEDQQSRTSQYVHMHQESVFSEAWFAYSAQIESGIANEVARNVLPVATYTRFYATANLNNWFKFLQLRNGRKGHPQHEIVEAALKVEGIIAELFPITYKAWLTHNGDPSAGSGGS